MYVSDSPEAHDSDILKKLAFPDGELVDSEYARLVCIISLLLSGTGPRCVRNALPTRRLLFADPQRQAGVPLLLQNANAVFGGVVGAFR